jgi:hypothetical protein
MCSLRCSVLKEERLIRSKHEVLINHHVHRKPGPDSQRGRFVVDESLDWQICRQIANHQKHGGSWDLMSIVKTVQVKPGGQGFAVPPSMRVVGAGDEIVIEYDGNRDSALAFAIRTFRHFHYIFEVAPIPPSERAAPDLAELLLRRNPVVS